MKKIVFSSLFVCFLATFLISQTIEEYQAQKAEKETALAALQGEISDLKAKIDAFPGWDVGSFGTLGFNVSRFSNWIKGANPNAVSSSIRGSLNAFANYDDPKQFWRNSGGLNVGWLKLDTDTDDPTDAEFEQVADVFRITSLYGYKLADKLALSALGDYNSSILSNFNNPGILDLGVGFTWTPVTNLVVVIHPINYHWVFGDDPAFDSGLGAKVMADYTAEISPGLTWKTNFTTFLPYKSTEPTLAEFTWVNSFGFNLWKGIGVGVEFGIRKAEVESADGQNYWVVGLSYAL